MYAFTDRMPARMAAYLEEPTGLPLIHIRSLPWYLVEARFGLISGPGRLRLRPFGESASPLRIARVVGGRACGEATPASLGSAL